MADKDQQNGDVEMNGDDSHDKTNGTNGGAARDDDRYLLHFPLVFNLKFQLIINIIHF